LKSLEAYSTALKYDSTAFVTHMDRAITYYNMNRPDLAIADLNADYRLDSNANEVFEKRAMMYFMMKQYFLAIKDYNTLNRRMPENGEIMYNISISWHDLNDNTNALKYALMAQKAGYKLPAGYLDILK
jgi:tetratricopeptide (TPR) repeat protein